MAKKQKAAAGLGAVVTRDAVPYDEIVAALKTGKDLALTADNGSFRVFLAGEAPVVVTEQTFLAALGEARRYWAHLRTLPNPPPAPAPAALEEETVDAEG